MSSPASRTVAGTPKPAAPPLFTQVANMMTQVLLSRATALARAGHYDSAELVLSGVASPAGPTPEMLDLLARIRAQQGRLAEAQTLWNSAAHLQPENERYRAALARIATFQRTTPWVYYGRFILIALVILLAVWLGVYGILRMATPPPAPAVVSHAVAPVTTAAVVPAKHLDLTVKVPGVVQTKDGENIVLRFESGLFSHGVALSKEGAATLADLGRQLGHALGSATAGVIGYTDDLPVKNSARFPDNDAIAIARADAVVAKLSAITGIPKHKWAIRHSAPASNPFPNDSMENRGKNRTVEIEIRP
jgi:type VI secretion system protein ImpK